MFAKVFSQILDSSLAENYQVRLVFEDLLKLAQPDGTVDITRESISRRTNVPLDIVTAGLDQLEQPDKSSRTRWTMKAGASFGWTIIEIGGGELLTSSNTGNQRRGKCSAWPKQTVKRNGGSGKGFPTPLPKQNYIEEE